jgi:hypothetical protein
LFVHQLADLIGVDHPQPAREDTRDNAYVFARRVTLARGDGTASEGRIDCYRRGAFVLEAKKAAPAARPAASTTRCCVQCSGRALPRGGRLPG